MRFTSLVLAAAVLVALLASCKTAPALSVDLAASPASAHPLATQPAEDRLTAHIAYLTSKECEGRLVGGEGDKKVASYLVDELKRMGISPLWKSSYLQEFTVALAETDSTLEVLDSSGAVTRSFTYFTEFCEVMYPNWGMNAAVGKIAVVDPDSGLPLTEGSVVMCRVWSDEIQDLIYAAASARCAAVLLCDAGLSLDSIPMKYMNRAPANIPFPVFRIHPRTYDELASKEGSKVRLTVKSEGIPSVRGWNVAGVVGDPSRQPTIVVCAHRDHMGMLKDGTMFPGGIDNASGVSVVLELARQIKAAKLNIAAVFLFADAEEVGLDGARYFAANLPFPAKNFAAAINLDCVGVPGTDTMEMNAGGGDASYALADAIVTALDKEGIPASVVDEPMASDHQAFVSAGLPAVGVLASVSSFRDYLHNSNDTADAVDPAELASLTRAIYEAILAGAKE